MQDMTISAATQYKLRTLHREDPSFLKNTLKDIAAGDSLALNALSERSGVSSGAELQEAARVFVQSSIDAIFATGGDRDVMNTIGNDGGTFSNPISSPGGRTSSILSARGGNVNYAALKRELLETNSEIDANVQATSKLEKEIGGLNEELVALNPNWRERNFNSFFARMTFADPNKAKKRSELEDKIENLGGQVAKQKSDLGALKRSKVSATVKQLKISGHKDFAALDRKFNKLSTTRKSLQKLRSDVRSAVSDIDSALWHERSESASEGAANRRPNNSTARERANRSEDLITEALGGGFGYTYNPSRDADEAIRRVQSKVSVVQNELNNNLEGSYSLSTPTSTSGELLDTIGDALGQGSILGRMGSINVINNLNNANREMDRLQGQIEGALRGLSNEMDQVLEPRNALIEETMTRALNS